MSDQSANASEQEQPVCDRCKETIPRSFFGGWAGSEWGKARSFTSFMLCQDCETELVEWMTGRSLHTDTEQ